MKPSIREYYNGQYTVQELRGYILYNWQRNFLNFFGGNFHQHRVYFRSAQ